MNFIFAFAIFASPVILTPVNTEVTYSVDSTWHEIHGKAKKVSGTLWIDSSRVEVHLPVVGFSSDNSRRDEKMRSVMESDKFPEVIFEGGPLPCDLTQQNISCSAELPGKLKIRDVTLPISVKVQAKKETNEALLISGTTELNWSDFGIADPSIFIAKLDKVVRVFLRLSLSQSDINPSNNKSPNINNGSK